MVDFGKPPSAGPRFAAYLPLAVAASAIAAAVFVLPLINVGSDAPPDLTDATLQALAAAPPAPGSPDCGARVTSSRRISRSMCSRDAFVLSVAQTLQIGGQRLRQIEYARLMDCSCGR